MWGRSQQDGELSMDDNHTWKSAGLNTPALISSLLAWGTDQSNNPGSNTIIIPISSVNQTYRIKKLVPSLRADDWLQTPPYIHLTQQHACKSSELHVKLKKLPLKTLSLKYFSQRTDRIWHTRAVIALQKLLEAVNINTWT